MGLPRVQYNQSSTQDTLITELASPASQWSKIKTSYSLTTSLAYFFSKIHARMQLHPHSMNSGWSAQLLKYLHIRVHSPSLANASDSLISTHVAHNLSLPRSSQSLDTSVSGDFVSGKVATTPELKLRSREEFINELIADKAKFDAYLYTDWKLVTRELSKRQKSQRLDDYVKKTLADGLPNIMRGKKSMVFARALATPNYEMHRFMTCSEVLSDLQPLVFQFTRDKFCNINTFKQSLGKLQICKGFNKNNEPLIQFKTIIDVNAANGKSFESIKTFSGETLPEYHKRKFLEHFPHMSNNFFNLSEWNEIDGKNAKLWYKKFLTLFLKDAVLFENFVTMEHEIEITRDIVLPAIAEIESETGYKPLIVALQTPSIEGHRFWESYPHTFTP